MHPVSFSMPQLICLSTCAAQVNRHLAEGILECSATCGLRKNRSALAVPAVLACMWMESELTTRRSQVLVTRVLAIPRAYPTGHIEIGFLLSGRSPSSTITKSLKFLMVTGRHLGIAPSTTSQGLVNATAASATALQSCRRVRGIQRAIVQLP